MRYVALLRGINVGGKNKLPMKELVALVAGLGATDVESYIQSGNVIFEASASVARDFAGKLEAAIEARFGFESPVVLRSASELAAVLENPPFGEAPLETRHVGFLAARPTEARVASLDPARSPGDSFVVRGSEIYLHLPNGVARSKLTNAYFDSKLGTTSTFRNWKTVVALAGLAARQSR
ncbi:MAG: DUF1697 domain-containing protein [Polyangiales bacterium]